MKIVFVCKGNVGRSPMAEALFKKKFGDKYDVISAGTKLSGPEQPIGELMPNIKEVLHAMNEEGIDVASYVRKQLTPAMISEADKVIVILEENEDILPDYLINSPKLEKWNIPDPKGKDLEFTRRVRDAIKEKINLFEI